MNPNKRARAIHVAIATGATMVVAATTAAAPQPESTQTQPASPLAKSPAAPPTTPDNAPAAAPAAAKLSAPELLDAVREKYAAAKSYADTGVVKTVLKASTTVNERRPFTTAFERGGRYRWEFRGSAVPGGTPTQRYVVWSRDQKVFESWWDLTKEHDLHETFDAAMAGPTGVSGGSANAIIPILRDKEQPWVLLVAMPEDRGNETIAKADCRKIGGATDFGDRVTMWIDGDLAIRKIFVVREVDPGKMKDSNGQPRAGEKFIAETTIELTPEFDQVIDDKKFEPPKRN